jgi:pantothenate kinase type III
MLLAINANNTNTKFAVWDGDALLGDWRVANDARRTADEYVVWLDHMLGLQGMSRATLDASIIASVVPEANFNLIRLCRHYCHSNPLIVGEPGVVIGAKALVDSPNEVGADRLINTVAAHDRYPGPAIIVDFGTATTLLRRRHRARHQPVTPGAGHGSGKIAERADPAHRQGYRHQHRRLHAIRHLLGLYRSCRRAGAADQG